MHLGDKSQINRLMEYCGKIAKSLRHNVGNIILYYELYHGRGYSGWRMEKAKNTSKNTADDHMPSRTKLPRNIFCQLGPVHIIILV